MTDQAFRERFHYDPDKDLIGSGGFGSVYRAYDNVEKRYVALKISQVKDIYGKFTLLNEVELSKKIDDHTNVARYEFGFRLKHPFPVDYAVMAYYEEGNLDMVLRKRFGQLTDKEYYEIVEGLLKGIGHLHNENIIHRDLKLANILMLRTRQGQWRPKIADFGLSRQIDDTDASIANSAIGITIAYAAPEQIEGNPIRKNVDLWALGVIVYRLLTGDMPFAAAQNTDPTNANLEMSRKITQVELPKKLDSVPEPYQTIIRRCFIKDAKERPQTASELLAILKQFKPDSNSWKDPNTGSSLGKFIPQSSTSFDEPIVATEIATPSVPKPTIVPKMEEIVEESTQIEMPSNSNTFGTYMSEGETLIELPSVSKSISSSLPQNVILESETLIEPLSESKNKFDENKTLIEPSSSPKILVDNSKMFIEPLSEPKITIDENKTLIDTHSTTKYKEIEKKTLPKKSKMFIGAGLLAVILSLGICQVIKRGDTTTTANATTETSMTVSNATTETPSVAANTVSNTATTTNTPKTDPKAVNTALVTKSGQPTTSTTPPTGTNATAQPATTVTIQPPVPVVTQSVSPSVKEQDDARRVAEEQEKIRKAEEAKKAVEAERSRIAAEAEGKRVAEEAERIRQEDAKKPVPPPSFLSANVNLFNKIECRNCCTELPKKGTIIFRNFFIEADGSISISGSSSVSIKNSKCQQGILDAFRKNCKFSPPKNGRYEYKNFPYSYSQ